MTNEVKRVRVRPIDLRGLTEGYSFPCLRVNCPGKSENEALPEGCKLPDIAKLISNLSLEEIKTRLVVANCSG